MQPHVGATGRTGPVYCVSDKFAGQACRKVPQTELNRGTIAELCTRRNSLRINQLQQVTSPGTVQERAIPDRLKHVNKL
ncbi:hypothetical protein AG1IA_03669 [Rhizoctonia solani AG-1 IA]|uniref:Uncharacterized protein n=1 Tax=Thanatephorus cucumeris (strain AG1-IA) TaxID=983506 RepID=L8WZR8_THACA|nr:hypothetical protein AG1IA_03669 [Rhizoctonia solani AG-1 IA]